MSSVDLSELVPDLVIQVTTPGGEQYPTVSEQEWTDRLRNGFWEAVLDGVIVGYEDVDGIVRPLTATGPALSRERQQLIIMYTAITIVRNELLRLKTLFRAKAGSTEYETQQAASVLVALLGQLADRQKALVDRIADDAGATPVYYFDGFTARQNAINQGYTSWVGA